MTKAHPTPLGWPDIFLAQGLTSMTTVSRASSDVVKLEQCGVHVLSLCHFKTQQDGVWY